MTGDGPVCFRVIRPDGTVLYQLMAASDIYGLWPPPPEIDDFPVPDWLTVSIPPPWLLQRRGPGEPGWMTTGERPVSSARTTSSR